MKDFDVFNVRAEIAAIAEVLFLNFYGSFTIIFFRWWFVSELSGLLMLERQFDGRRVRVRHLVPFALLFNRFSNIPETRGVRKGLNPPFIMSLHDYFPI